MSYRKSFSGYVLLTIGLLCIALTAALDDPVPERAKLALLSGNVGWSASHGHGGVDFRIAGDDRVFTINTRSQQVRTNLLPAFSQRVTILFEPQESGRQTVWELRSVDQLVLSYDSQAKSRQRNRLNGLWLGAALLTAGSVLLAWQSRKRRTAGEA